MAFQVSNEGNNNKQHLNLSTLAYEVVASDMFTFKEEKLSGFINRAFEYYRPKAESSISLTLNQLKGELTELMADFKGDEKTKTRVLEKLIKQKEESLKTKVESYENGTSFKFWLNKSNLDYLSEPSSECSEDKYYKSRGKYIKSVIEEYARLPYVEREKVYFSPFITEIQNAIREERQLRIQTDKNVFSVYPHKILSDPLSTANYLIGYCNRYNSEEEKRPCSFRISSLKSVRLEKSKSAFLKRSKWEELSTTITSRGVQFLMGDEAEIRVRLTKKGVIKYRRLIHLRPPLINKEEDSIYVYKCTTAQAEFYFFKFGKDAEILSPEYLRKRFKSMYKAATNTYSGQGRCNNEH